MTKTFPYAKQTIEDDDRQAVLEALSDPFITRGPKVEAFEEAVAHWCGACHAVAFNSGSSALHAAMFAVNVSPSDQILTTPNTFVGTVAGGLQLGAHLSLSDIDPSTGNLDLTSLEIKRTSSRGKTVIVPVHYAGHPIDVAQLDRQITDPGAVVIEDGAHALGATYSNGKRVGCCSHSALTVFSFHPVKTMTTGEGGVVLTNDPLLAEKLRLFRNNGIVKKEEAWLYEVVATTGNYHMTDLQAALGLSQFKKIDQFVEKRRKLVARYRKKLTDIKHLTLLDPTGDDRSAHHIMVIQIDFEAIGKSRQQVMEALQKKGIGTQVHYIPLYHHPAIPSKERLPHMEAFYAKALSLPLYPTLETSDVDGICRHLLKAIGHK